MFDGGNDTISAFRLSVRCSAVTSAGYELALSGSQTCNIWLPKYLYHRLSPR